MIKVQELRVGNYVYLHKENDYEKEKTIYQIDSGYDLYKLDESDCADISPITLTEALILKCGFDKNIAIGSKWYVFRVDKEGHKPSIEVVIYMTQNGKFETGDDLPMTSLHQLQNYFYAKTGEELKFNYK